LAFGSLAWSRVQALQDRVVGRIQSETNRFGRVDDMQALAQTLRADVDERLAEFPDRLSLDPALVAFLDLSASHRVRTLVVEIPMPAPHRAALARSPGAPRVRAALARRLAKQGGVLVDLGTPAWLAERHFADGLHLGSEGAQAFTRDLAEAVERYQSGAQPARPGGSGLAQ
jgi:hypothetical protein